MFAIGFKFDNSQTYFNTGFCPLISYLNNQNPKTHDTDTIISRYFYENCDVDWI